MRDIMESMYLPDDRDRAVFGERYSPPERFTHGEWHMVARYEKVGGDGQAVEVDECRMPASFFRIRVLPGVNSIGEPTSGYTLSTGSGMERLAHEIASAACEGMIGIRERE